METFKKKIKSNFLPLSFTRRSFINSNKSCDKEDDLYKKKKTKKMIIKNIYIYIYILWHQLLS